MGAIAQLIIQVAPDIIRLVQERHAVNNPDAPPLTAQQIEDGFEEAFTSTLLTDALIRAANR